MQYPEYVSHKVVEAFEIGHIETREVGATLVPADKNLAPHEVSAQYMSKHVPKVGGYWVKYSDGYESWSPKDAFESGYTLKDA